MAIIKFSAGHGAGKAYNRGGVLFNEGDQNKVMTDKLVSFLAKNYDGNFSEIRSQKGNYDYNLNVRSAYGSGADLFYSWHTNAFNGKARGVEVILSYQSLAYLGFAKELCKVISRTLNIPNRGVIFRDYYTGAITKSGRANQTNYYGELRGNKAKCAVLVEHCFHDNRTDATSLIQNQDKLIANISAVIAKHFKLKKKGTPVTKPVVSSNTKTVGQLAKVTTSVLNIRKGPGTNYPVCGQIKDKGTYTIVETKNGWGKLKSGAGWISLYYTSLKGLPTEKSNAEIAKEVILGKWGNGSDRKKRLEQAGYNYSAVQKEVNKLVK